MMQGKMREYNWRDIMRLIHADAGMKNPVDVRTLRETWYVGGFQAPKIETHTIVRVTVCDKPWEQRTKEHTE